MYEENIFIAIIIIINFPGFYYYFCVPCPVRLKDARAKSIDKILHEPRAKITDDSTPNLRGKQTTLLAVAILLKHITYPLQTNI